MIRILQQRSRWTHSTCRPCWDALNPDREPVVMKDEYRKRERCCRCGVGHRSGIYVRQDSSTLLCQGVHEEAT